jgi:hypothetical protein
LFPHIPAENPNNQTKDNLFIVKLKHRAAVVPNPTSLTPARQSQKGVRGDGHTYTVSTHVFTAGYTSASNMVIIFAYMTCAEMSKVIGSGGLLLLPVAVGQIGARARDLRMIDRCIVRLMRSDRCMMKRRSTVGSNSRAAQVSCGKLAYILILTRLLKPTRATSWPRHFCSSEYE